MKVLISQIHPFLLLLLLVGGMAVISLFWFFVFYKLIHSKDREWKETRFIASFFTIIGALLGLVLAMVLVEIWQNFYKEKENVTSEAATYASLYRDFRDLPEEYQDTARKYHKEILGYIINDSWPKMKEGLEGLKEKESLEKLLDYLVKIETKEIQEKLDKNAMVDRVKNLTELRKSRNLKVSSSMIPEMMWWVIGMAIIISIFCGFLFPIRPVFVHVILVEMHSAMIGIILYLILAMMYPFREPISISPEPFENLINISIPAIDKIYNSTR